MSFAHRYRLSAHAVITNDAGQVLQIKQSYGDGRWGLPGGGLEPGETIHAALRRECHEELGVDVAIEYLSGVYFHSEFDCHAFIFRCRLSADAEVRLSNEHVEYRYFEPADLAPVQRRRVDDCLHFDGEVKSASFQTATVNEV
jgi:8-oxo-dGTP pyrophosphatase MutT (NUDIX family)